MNALNKIAGSRYNAKTKDDTVIKKANELSDEDEEALIEAVAEYVVNGD